MQQDDDKHVELVEVMDTQRAFDSNQMRHLAEGPQQRTLSRVLTEIGMPGRAVPNEMYRDFLGVCGLNPFIQHDSSSRVQMFSSHIGQTLVVKGATERRIQTGMEREYAKYTFSTKMPVDAVILKVIERYPKTIGENAIKHNPQTLIIYEDYHTKQVGCVSVTDFCSYHQYFGFPYKRQPGMNQVAVGKSVPAETILMDSPAVTDSGGYKYGVECNMAFMTMPGVSEDGIVISRDVLSKFSFKTYEHRVVEFGAKRFPLNLYGDPDNLLDYRPFPDIGETIRSDGLLMALRSYDETTAVVEMGVNDLREPDFIFDKLVYAAGPGGRIIDIRVQHDRDNPQSATPMGMEIQATKYDEARRQFYNEILKTYYGLKNKNNLTPEFHRMVVEAISVVGKPKDGKRVQKLYRQAPLDDWRIEFVIEYDITPTVGFKLTDCHGGKGVICHIAEPHEMPVDQDGNRADIVMDPNSTVSRMNIGRLYEQYINAASRDVSKRLRNDLGVKEGDPRAAQLAADLEAKQPERFNMAWDYLMGYYKIVSPRMYVWFTAGAYQASRAQHLGAVLREGVYLYMPPENDPETEEIIKELEKYYRPTYGPVSYIGNSGRRIVTKNPVRIGSLYVILLEKIGDDWTAVSSGKLQHFGVLSQVTNTDKFSQPSRNQAIRALGESEVRIYVSYAGPHITAEILDRNNNPAAHRDILFNILEAERPTNIVSAVDRSRVPLGGSKPLQLVKHIAECGGWGFHYQIHQPTV